MRGSPGGAAENEWGAYRMKPWARMVRGLALVCVVLGGTALGWAALCVFAARTAAAQTVSAIVVEGNRRVEADTIRSYFRAGPGGRLDAAAIDDGLKALYATGLFQDIRLDQSGGGVGGGAGAEPVLQHLHLRGNKHLTGPPHDPPAQTQPRGGAAP